MRGGWGGFFFSLLLFLFPFFLRAWLPSFCFGFCTPLRRGKESRAHLLLPCLLFVLCVNQKPHLSSSARSGTGRKERGRERERERDRKGEKRRRETERETRETPPLVSKQVKIGTLAFYRTGGGTNSLTDSLSTPKTAADSRTREGEEWGGKPKWWWWYWFFPFRGRGRGRGGGENKEVERPGLSGRKG